MPTIHHVSLIGLGAIGASYAAKLHAMDNQCLQIVADAPRIERYRREGVFVNGERYDFNYVTPDMPLDPPDLVLVAVKYDGLDGAIQSLRNHVGPDTIILSLMNGISSEEMLGHAFGMDRVLYGMCVEIDALRIGTSVTYSTFGRVCFGEKTNKVISPKVEAVQSLFERAGIPYEIPDDMQRMMWWKFMINVGINQTSAVLRAPYGVFQQQKEARDVMHAAMREVLALSEKIGVHLTEQDIERFHPILNALSPEAKTSMLQDIEAGRTTEVEYLAGTVCQLGRVYDVPTPVNDMLLKMIRVLQNGHA
ncbi:ketopantoate reductase family protein [Alicyclobacillus shizuokensis]|uniref:ketopantoate reductase family protein n=1 Tax=Alicyclobacillus shizuokensis TaxID=392014 RepID=UPI0008361CE4|nr:ketopantoate reductase family protein [Alicyclobacillus shizuokensis]MCL6625275.1 ketopantoate reductase family protein [Alicyclobacillus shizuokensis]